MKVSENRPGSYLLPRKQEHHVGTHAKSVPGRAGRAEYPNNEPTQYASTRALNGLILDLLNHLDKAEKQNSFLSSSSLVPTNSNLERLTAEPLSLTDRLSRIINFDHPASELVTAKVRGALDAKLARDSFSFRAASIGIEFGDNKLLAVDQTAPEQALYSRPQETRATLGELIDVLRQALQFYIDPDTGTLIKLNNERRRAIEKKCIKEEAYGTKDQEELEKRIHLVEALVCSSNELTDRLSRHMELVRPQPRRADLKDI